MDEQDVKDMAEVTRTHARKEDLDQRTPVGSHGFPKDAPASDMTRQHSNPSDEQRGRDDFTDDDPES